MGTMTYDLIENDVNIQQPKMYAVVIHNDDITTMDFVTEVLINIFHKTPVTAASLMIDVHERGHGIAGVYVFDIAVTKKSQADTMSAERGFPLKITIREEGV